MSYDIVYQRQFIKTTDGRIIPFVLVGSNNLYEAGHRRRCRDWSVCYIGANRNIALSPEALMELVRTEHTGGPYQEHFKRNGSWVDDAALIRFFEKGIKQAMTIEELAGTYLAPDFAGYLSIWNKESTSYLPDCRNGPHYIRTSGDLGQFLQAAQNRIDARDQSKMVSVQLELIGGLIPRQVKMPRPKPERLQAGFVLSGSRGGETLYLYQLTARKMQFCRQAEYARQFHTEMQAQRWLQEHKAKVDFVAKSNIILHVTPFRLNDDTPSLFTA